MRGYLTERVAYLKQDPELVLVLLSGGEDPVDEGAVDFLPDANNPNPLLADTLGTRTTGHSRGFLNL